MLWRVQPKRVPAPVKKISSLSPTPPVIGHGFPRALRPRCRLNPSEASTGFCATRCLRLHTVGLTSGLCEMRES